MAASPRSDSARDTGKLSSAVSLSLSLAAAPNSHAADPGSPPTVLVTHHPEEVPVGTTHALLLSRGRTVAAGPVADVLTAQQLSRAFGLPLVVDQRDGRFTARASLS